MLFKSVHCNPYFTDFLFLFFSLSLSVFVIPSSPRMGTRTGSFLLLGSMTLWLCLVKLPFCREFWCGGEGEKLNSKGIVV